MAGIYQLLIVFTIGAIGADAWYPGEKPILPVPTECPLEDPLDYTVHLAHESDCTKFYKCAHGQKYEMQCPESWQGGRLHFHKVLQVCAYPKDAGCELPPKSSEESSGDSSDGNGDGSDGNGDGSDGNGDGSDGNGDGSDGKGDSDEINGSDGNNSSDDSSSSSGDCNDEDPCPPGSNGKKIPHECVCNKYYVCKDGNLILQSCSKGKHWSTSRNKCVKAEFAYCI